MEELVKNLLEDPEMTAASAGIAAGTAYAALTYVAGRSFNYGTLKEAEETLENDIYSSRLDYLKGLYDKGKEHAARVDIYEKTSMETDLEEEWEKARSEVEHSHGD